MLKLLRRQQLPLRSVHSNAKSSACSSAGEKILARVPLRVAKSADPQHICQRQSRSYPTWHGYSQIADRIPEPASPAQCPFPIALWPAEDRTRHTSRAPECSVDLTRERDE